VAKIEFSTDFSYATLFPGATVKLSYDPLGIVESLFRIDSIDFPGVDGLDLKFKATQVAESLFDTNFEELEGSEYARNPMEPSPYPRYRSEIILPNNSVTGEIPHRLFLIERAKDSEIGYMVQARVGDPPSTPYSAGSDAAEGYYNVGFLRSFSRCVDISVPADYIYDPATYPLYPLVFDHTDDYDEGTEGITIFTSDSHPLDLTQYPDISEAELETANRLLLVTTLFSDGGTEKATWTHESAEFISFRTIELISNPTTGIYSDPSYSFYKIRYFKRAALNTTKETHQYQYQGLDLRWPQKVWLCSVRNNYLPESQCGTYRVILPNVPGKQASPADTHPYWPDGKTYAVEQDTVFDPTP
jgi:hypothetical protein